MMRSPNHFLLTLLLAVLSAPLFAQTGKVGYVDFEAIYKLHPNTKLLKQQLDADKQKTQKDLQGRLSSVEQKAKAYQATLVSAADTTAHHHPRQQTAEANRQMVEVMQLSELLREEHNAASKSFREKEEKLKNLVEQKVKKATEEVALEQGYSSILPLGEAYVHAPAANLTQAVLLKLGIK